MPAAKVRVNYEELGAIEHQFYDQAEAVDKLVCTLQNMLDHLRANWTGENADAFFKEMDHAVLPPLDRLMRALKQAGAATREVSAIFQEGEEEAAAFFKGDAWVGGASGALSGALPGIFGGAGGGSLPGGFAGGGGGGGGGGAFGDEKKPLKFEKFPMTLISGTRAEVFARVAAGQMTPQQAADLLKKMQSSPFDPRWSDYIKGKVTFFSESTGTEQALLDGTLSSDLGSVRGSLLGYETKASAWGGIDKSGLGISGTLSGSVYAARLRESLTVGDLNVTTDTSLLSADAQLKGQLSVSRQGVSAEASAGVNAYLFNSRVDAHIGGLDAALQADAGVMLDGKVKAAVNPLNGDLGVSAEGNAFVGIRERAQATYTMGFLKVGVQGELDQGVGVGGKAKVGFEKGVFRFDVGAYASDGIGAGGGVIVEIDAVEAGKQVVEWAEAGIDGMFGH